MINASALSILPQPGKDASCASASCTYLPYRWSRDLGASLAQNYCILLSALLSKRGPERNMRLRLELAGSVVIRLQPGKREVPHVINVCITVVTTGKCTVPPPFARGRVFSPAYLPCASLGKYLRIGEV